MRVLQTFAYLALATQTANTASLPNTNNALSVLEGHVASLPRSAEMVSPDHTLERRKGGGGRGGGSSSSSSGSSSSGSSSSSGGGARSGGTSSVGGSTRAGSGATRSYGSGGFYGGGAAVPYKAGSRTPKGLVAGALIAPVLLLAIMPGLWLYNVYPYHYNNPYRFYNQSAINSTYPTGFNQSLPVTCLCEEFLVCGCDENDDQKYLTDLVGNGSYAALNKSLVTVAMVNNTQSLIINGSLPNGTTAPGGVDDATAAAAAGLSVGKYTGYWAMGLVVLYGVLM